MSNSARLGLPFLEPGQAQKEWFHNEALALLDIAVQPVVAGVRDAAPADPPVGECWIVGDGASGAWSGHAGAIAGSTTGGWRFVAPRPGMTAWNLAEGTTVRYGPGGWGLDRSVPIAVPDGGTTVDAECRAAVSAMLAAMRARGWLT